MKIATFILVISALVLSYSCRAESADSKAGTNDSIQETYSCKPFGKTGAVIARISVSSKASYEEVVDKGEAEATGKATSIEGTEGKTSVFKIPELPLKGTAYNSTKGVYFELNPVSAGDIKEILIAAPASGKGGSAITLNNDKIYSMDCGPVSK